MIEINNLTINQIDENFLEKVAKIVLKSENKKEGNLSIALVGQGRMRQINKKYRGKNKVTDVLAFPETKILKEKFKVGPWQKISGLGEVIICVREIKKNARRFARLEITEAQKKYKEGKSLTGRAGFELEFEKELARVLIHGVLHILGYDHEKSEREAEKMREKEDYYLSKIN